MAMKKGFFLFLIGLYLINSAAAQTPFDEATFLQEMKTSYYTLENTKLQNFIASVSSAKFDVFTKQNWDTIGMAPIKIIWQRPDKIYISELKFPFRMTASQKKTYREIVDAMKLQLKGILLDLQRFYLNGLLDENLMSKYVLRHNEQQVQMTFSEIDNQGTTVKYLLGLNGLCLMIDIEYPLQNKAMVLYPVFDTVEGKWLCKGWTVQNAVAGQVVSGFKLTVNYKKHLGYWLPESFYIEVQKVDKKDRIFYDELKLFNYMLDQTITITGAKNKEQK